MKKVNLLAIVLISTVGFSAAQAGPSTSGGGDAVSQDFMTVVRSLPNVVNLLGVRNFPEINVIALKAKVEDVSIRIELGENLSVGGAPKDAVNIPSENKIRIDSDQWAAIHSSLARKTALALHEVLGLMRVEQNDDYHVSNRLLSMMSNPAIAGIFTGTGRVVQIVSGNIGDRAAILITEQGDGTQDFLYCGVREDLQTCSHIGTRSYSRAELSQAAILLNQKKNSHLHGERITHFVSGGLVLVLGAAGAFFGPPGIIIGATAGAAIAAGPLENGLAPTFATPLEKTRDDLSVMRLVFSADKSGRQIVLDGSGVAYSLKACANSLNSTLNQLH